MVRGVRRAQVFAREADLGRVGAVRGNHRSVGPVSRRRAHVARRVPDRRAERTVALLEREGWTVTPQGRRPGAHRPDLLLSGPAGVYLLEIKSMGGRVEIDVDGMAVT